MLPIFLFILLPLTLSLNDDVSMIAYFSIPCPEGWQPFLPASGRFILSADTSYPPGSTGGEPTHTLTIPEIPNHNHQNTQNPLYKYLTRDSATGGQASADSVFDPTPSEPNVKSFGVMSDVGGNQAHENMPQYIALNACQKTLSAFVQELDQMAANMSVVASLNQAQTNLTKVVSAIVAEESQYESNQKAIADSISADIIWNNQTYLSSLEDFNLNNSDFNEIIKDNVNFRMSEIKDLINEDMSIRETREQLIDKIAWVRERKDNYSLKLESNDSLLNVTFSVKKADVDNDLTLELNNLKDKMFILKRLVGCGFALSAIVFLGALVAGIKIGIWMKNNQGMAVNARSALTNVT